MVVQSRAVTTRYRPITVDATIEIRSTSATVHGLMVVCTLTGDVAARLVLSPGDEIISVNGREFSELSLYEAWNYLKALPDGVVSLCIKRRNKPVPVPPVLFL